MAKARRKNNSTETDESTLRPIAAALPESANTVHRANPPKAIIAIGGSAGSLEALERFFDTVPKNSGCAFVVIQHLDPNFRSMMDELLARHSEIPIHKITDMMRIDGDAIYLNPARQDMHIERGHFRLQPSGRNRGINLPINCFFESLAKECGSEAIGIVLSGTGTDGTDGCKAIKRAGGKVFVQEPASAKFEPMPASVISNDLADAVAAPEKLPELVFQSLSGDFPGKPVVPRRDEEKDPLSAVFAIMKARFKTDFSVYKEVTMERRIRRRMAIIGVSDMLDYADMLSIERNEVAALYKDLVVGVTTFFRDAEAFRRLSAVAITPLVELMAEDREIRVWVAGCSTGEEAFSIAVSFCEAARLAGKIPNIKILATDIHESAINTASLGTYAPEAFNMLDAETVRRYFDQDGDALKVKKSLRKLIVFSQHDILRDPPFTRIDLLTCRNVLIYFNDKAQRYALRLFHFALKKNGVLFLGPSESLGDVADEFEVLHQKWRLFRKLRNSRLIESGASMLHRGSELPEANRTTDPRLSRARVIGVDRDLRRSTNGALRELLARYAPPGFLITKDGAIVHIFGKATRYVQILPGIFSQNVTEVLPARLGLVVANALSGNLVREGARKFRRSVRSRDESRELVENITIEALPDEDGGTDFLLLTIEEHEIRNGVPPLAPVADVSAAVLSDHEDETVLDLRRRVEELHADLQSTEENLQSAIEELATSNEELQSTNEELMSSNEELQSTNEELHSVNEELYTVSAEHQRKIEELIQLTHDMDHLLKATEIGTIFLDEHNCVRRFTPAAAAAFNLIPHDVGRPISHITLRFDGVDFLALVEKVKQTRLLEEREVTVNGRAYFLRILAYRAEGIDRLGTIVTIVDIEAIKQAEAKLRALDARQTRILANLHEAILSWDAKDHRVLFCNEAFASYCGRPKDEIIGKPLVEALPAAQYDQCVAVLPLITPHAAQTLTFKLEDPNGAVHWRVKKIIGIYDDAGEIISYLSTGSEISETMRYREALERLSIINPPIDTPLKDTVRGVLELGARFLGLTHGWLSRVEGGELRLESQFGPVEFERIVRPIHRYPCALVLARQEMVVIDEAAADSRGPGINLSDWDYATYIGVPVSDGEHFWGTLCFFARGKPLYGPLTEAQRGFVRMVARWVEMKIHALSQHQALVRNEAELRLIFDNVPTRIWLRDEHGVVLRTNLSAAKTLDADPDELEGKSMDALFPAEGADWLSDDLAMIASGQTRRSEIQQVHLANGRTHWAKKDKIIHVNEVTGERSVLIVSTDITDMKQREVELEAISAALDSSRGQFKQFYRKTPAMMHTATAEGMLVEVSDFWIEKTGYSRAEVIGQPFINFLVPESRERAVKEVLPALAQTGSCLAVPLRLHTRGGAILDVEFSAFIDVNGNASVPCFAVLVDVTNHNLAAAELVQANRELGSANESLRKFAHIASHDLQEPLRKICQFGDLLTQELGEALPEDGKFYVKVMQDAAERMRRLIRDILAFSKSVNSKMERQPLRLDEVVRDVMDDLEVAIADSKAKIEFGDLPQILGDRTAVQQLLRNILSNSIKYRRQELAPEISIGAQKLADGSLRIAIKDNGCGFEARFKETIFNPFTRLHTSSQVEGSGIGLAVCKSVCDRHKWALDVESTPNEGSEFAVTVPVADLMENGLDG